MSEQKTQETQVKKIDTGARKLEEGKAGAAKNGELEGQNAMSTNIINCLNGSCLDNA